MWNWSENQIRLVLIRHGATPANKEHRYLGKTDEQLSKEGICELQRVKAANIYPKADWVFCSPMKRCMETAEIVYPGKETILIPEWEEIDFGDFERKNYIELQGDERYQKWIDSNGTLPFPKGESREAFISRCEQGLYRMLDCLSTLIGEEQKTEITIALIVHGGTIMALLSNFHGGEYFDYQVANGKGYVCSLKKKEDYPEITEIEKIMQE